MIKKILHFISSFDAKKISFSVKFSLLVYGLLLLTAFATIGISIYSSKQAFKKHYHWQLYEAGILKQTEVELKLNSFVSDIKSILATDEMGEITQGFIESFFDYKSENSDLFDPSIIEQYKSILKEYYSFELLEQYSVMPPNVDALIPTDELGLIFQFRYQVENPRRLSEKKLLIDNGDGSSYNQQHVNYHARFLNYAKKWGVQDIYLVDSRNGSVVYNTNKNIAFATDLYQGNYRNTGLSRTFKDVNASNKPGYVHFEDYSDFLPGYNQSTAFIGFPVYKYGQKIAVFIVELPTQFFTTFMQSVVNDANGGVNYNLVGPDKLLRNNPAGIDSDFDHFYRRISKTEKDTTIVKSIEVYRNCVAKVSFSDELHLPTHKAHATTLIKDYFGRKSLAHIQPIQIIDQQWFLLTSKNVRSINSELSYLFRWLLIVFILLTIVSIYGVIRFRKLFSRRLSGLKNSMFRLSTGESSKELEVDVMDELGQIIDAYNQLSKRIISASEFAVELSLGNFQIEFQESGDNDVMAHSLNTLKERLKRNLDEEEARKREDEIRLWVNDGIAKFNDILRQSNDDIRLLSDLVITNLVNYIGANIGGIFLIEGESEEEKSINLVSAFAYDRKKHLEKRYALDEGLLGNCYLEKKPVYLKEIPEDYIVLRSGLGQAQPRCLFIFPLIVDSTVLGMIEIASISEFESYQLDFLERVGENIGATFKTVRLNSQTAELLEVSKRRANEIAQQEEEMRQNLEEMQATQEELARLRDEDEKRVADMQAKIEGHNRMFKGLLNGLHGEAVIKDEQGIIVYANNEFAHSLKLHMDDILGKPMSDLLEPDQSRKDSETDEEVKHTGDVSWNEIDTIKGEEVHYHIQKRRFYIDTHQQRGILYIRCRVH